jgi:hypothetical protein
VDYVDWLDFELGEYQDSLDHCVRQAYVAAYSVLEGEYRKASEQLQQDLRKTNDGSDIEFSRDIIQYEEDRWMEQTEALAAMALALLASLNKWFLDLQKKRTTTTHPPNSKGYVGKSQLHKQVTEYKARFGVDLEKIDGFEAVREVELARHCCVHNEGLLTEDYRTQTKQRLVDDSVKINLNPEKLDVLIKELSGFGDSLSDQMREVRRRATQGTE